MMKSILLGILFFVPYVGHSQIVINEVCATNADINYDPDFFNFSPWVELYNSGNASVNIGGFNLSDDLADKFKWQIPAGTMIPAKGYLLIWCDQMNSGVHASFSLDPNGEVVILSSNTQAVLDQIQFPKQFSNVSYGRTQTGGWANLVTPTPAQQNNSKSASTLVNTPQLSLTPGRYQSAQTVTIGQVGGVELRYTIDGSEPIQTSSLYSAPISIPKTTTLKVKAFGENLIPSNTVTATYFINEHAFTLPVISISTKPKYLWDNQIGIYGDGTNGITGNCKNEPVNWNQDWARHSTIELFDKQGVKKFDQHVDVRIGGGCSRNNPQKSLVIKARNKYGDNTIQEKLFDTKLNETFGGFILRNSGNDFNVTMFRDALMQSLTIGQMDVDYLAYQPAIFYLNGEYWGIQNIREKIDGDYIESNYGIKKEDIDLVESWGNAIEGSADAYNTYLATLATLNPVEPSTYDFIKNNIDVQEFINYLVTEIYFGNTDWPGNNVKFWRQRSTNGKFRWILWDLDFGFGLFPGHSYSTHPTLNFATDPNSGVGWPNPPWSTLHLRLLLQNPTFKSQFIQTMITAIGTSFHPQRIDDFVTNFKQRLNEEMPFHKVRWGGNMATWNNEVQRLHNFSVERNQFMKQHVASFFGLNDRVLISAHTSPDYTGSIRLNGVTLSQPLEAAEYFWGLPYRVEPIPLPGYAFKHWKITKREITEVLLIDQNQSWKYFDQGILPAADWQTVNYSDNGWSSGNSQLGYGDGDEQTVVSYGPDALNKFITTYFRKEFTLNEASTIDGLKGSILFDDGVVVYLNGVEVYRNNMPAGAVSNGTLALQAVVDENAFTSFTLPAGLLTTGKNVVAVEVHQVSPQSSDISFDFSLKSVVAGNQQELVISDRIYAGAADSNISIEAVFEETQPINGLIINEVSAKNNSYPDEFNETDDWIELLNTGSVPVNLGDLYITDNLNTKLKYRIPDGGDKTRLLPGQYKLLWADKQPGQGPLHINLQLSSDGEAVGIYQFVGSNLQMLDEMEFPFQHAGSSSARIPNATGPFVLTSKPTPGGENIFEVTTGVENFRLDKQLQIFPNPTDDHIQIISEEEITEVSVFNAQGNLVFQQPMHSMNGTISLNAYNSGLYLIKLRIGNKEITRKVIRK
ncbi:MAG: CotH kinase family protein [Cyclobacteriaceae bacterium]|nr:CotH kinase family protein [Cyclobacteriaceae bacterium]